MPPWSKDEMGIISPYFEHSSNWMDKFEVLGGIPRPVLKMNIVNPRAYLEAVCIQCSMDICMTAIGINAEVTTKSEIVHRLIHIISSPPYTESSICFASATAIEVVVQEKLQLDKNSMKSFLCACEGSKLYSSITGYLFEHHVMEVLQQGGTFTCQELDHPNKKEKHGDSTIVIPQSSKKVVEGTDNNQTQNQLYVPRTKNFKGVDAWIPGIGAFQITVGKTHLLYDSTKDVLAKLGDSNKLYWVLHVVNYEGFTKKFPYNIKQYALKMYPNPYFENP
jgi:hypothetical protein